MSSETQKFKTYSKRPFIILTIAFVIVVIIVGVVTWKVTKDEYESPSVGEIKDPEDNTGSQPTTTEKPSYTEEELRAKPWLSLRMTRDVLPVHYDITMFPNFYDDHGEFYGNETIELQVSKPTRFFLIHIHTTYMNVTNSMLVDNVTGEDIGVKRTFYYAPNEFFVIEADREVDSAVKMKLQFEGSLTKAIVGIYKSTYLNTKTGQERSLSSSKFEPTFARQAFPCFDEPNIKAEYTITLIHRPDYIALSNMPQDGSSMPYEWDSSLVATKFQRSVKMSTYLVCFTVCDFQSVTATSNRGIPIRVYATPDKIDQADYALRVAKHTLDYYEDLFSVEYPLPKQDLIAIPDFVSGAMEHWGLISFRESRILYDPNAASLESKQTVAMVIAHEMAHQWFGNIVTMDWWNDLWLNEGFASFMEYVGVASLETEWNMESMLIVQDLFPVMKDDSELSSHPIIVTVNNPSEITSVFDAISYYKGSSVIGMLEAIMGKEKFFSGVTIYLDRYKWGNAKTDDLWKALTEADTNRDVKHIMDTWTLQDGFPYVSVSMSTSSSGLTTIEAKQKRFMSNPGTVVDPSASPLGYKWYISLDYLSSGGVNGTKVMDMVDVNFDVSVGLRQGDGWIKFNHGQHGFYRVLYPDAIWSRFSQHLQNTDYMNWMLSTPDRAGLLNDAFNLAAAGLTSYEIPLEMMSYLAEEREFIPWDAVLSGGIYYINYMMTFDPELGRWNKFLVDKLNPAIQRLGYTDYGTYIERRLRPLLLEVACSAGDPATVATIKEQFRDWLDNNVSIPVNLRETVYTNGMTLGGTEEDFEKIWQKYLVEPSPQEKESLAAALASVREPHLISKLLDYAKRADGIKTQDFFVVVRNVGYNPAAMGILWDWARSNYQFFIDRFTIMDRSFGRMIYYMVRYYNTPFKLQEVKDFFADYPEAGAGERYRKMAYEAIERNSYWMEHYRPVIVNWLKNL